jgi:iron complex outermembrane receptor protein
MFSFPTTRAILAVFTPFFLSSSLAIFADGSGSITGRVVTTDDQPVAEATTHLVDLHRKTVSDSEGTFYFDKVPAGSYLLEVERPGVGSAILRVVVHPGAKSEVEVRLALIRHDDEIVVTSTGLLRSQDELAQATEVLVGEELLFRQQATLGETLAQQPGISSTSFGAGASRPVIRGLGGDRVRMLEGGLGVGDASSTSPDHAVASDPASAERIEVLRGPATLLYGSSAIGGVINVIDSRIPNFQPGVPLTGFLELRGGSVANERSASVNLSGGKEAWAWHLDAFSRTTDDYDIPGFAALEDDGREEGIQAKEGPSFGTLSNSDLETFSSSLGATRFFDRGGFLGFSISEFITEYGIPGGQGPSVRLDLQRLRYDLRGEFELSDGPFEHLKLRLGVVDYKHDELEGEAREVSTTFFNDSWETRVELAQRPQGGLAGLVGLQVSVRDLESVGEEAFLPATQRTNFAVFAFEELKRGAVRFQFGTRYETQNIKAEDSTLPEPSFSGLSASFGTVWQPREGYSLGASAARSVKQPGPQELYSNGPHFATNAFEVGDTQLKEETSWGLDLALRKTTGRLTGTLSLFANRFDDFIYQDFSGEIAEGLPVLVYTQDNAEFTGAELDLRFDLWEKGNHHLDLTLGADSVHAKLTKTNTPLPRIPPRSLSLGLHYHSNQWHAFVEGRFIDTQDRVTERETPTDSYTLLGMGLSYRLLLGDRIYDLLLRGRNLTNEDARNHISFLKNRVPLPGRDLSLAFRWTF